MLRRLVGRLMLGCMLTPMALSVRADPQGGGPGGTPGPAANTSYQVGCVYTAAGVAPSTGQQMGLPCDASGRLITSATVSATVGVAALTTIPVGGTITTHLTFQTALAANGSRNGCTIQNRSTDTELVYFGSNGSATSAKAFALGPAAATGGAGGAISCAVGGLGVATDNIAITSLVTDGATYTVASQ